MRQSGHMGPIGGYRQGTLPLGGNILVSKHHEKEDSVNGAKSVFFSYEESSNAYCGLLCCRLRYV
jgi:hypothetical protein